MLYEDELYGKIRLPQIVQDLLPTSVVQRLKTISQDVLPQECLPWPVPSRYEHSLGVACLATIVADNNPQLKKTKNLLVASALLHDAGNSGLSHLNEPFLKLVTGKDGESNLERVLVGTDTAAVLEGYDLSIEQVVRFVTGNSRPHSIVLHGSLDIDNLDNVSRYWFVANHGQLKCDPMKIAMAYRFDGESWYFTDPIYREVQKWQRLRAAVYTTIYNDPHLAAAQMIWHAVDLAYRRNVLTSEYFALGDMEAMRFLAKNDSNAKKLVNLVTNHEWYETIYSLATVVPSPRLAKLAEDPMQRSNVARDLRSYTGLPDAALCCYIGKGRDKRRVELPFIGSEDKAWFDTNESPAVYRVRFYLDPCCIEERPAILRACAELIDSHVV
jgi:HD superfamily phosphohydrolase